MRKGNGKEYLVSSPDTIVEWVVASAEDKLKYFKVYIQGSEGLCKCVALQLW